MNTSRMAMLATELESAYALLIGAADQVDMELARGLILQGANLIEIATTELLDITRELEAANEKR